MHDHDWHRLVPSPFMLLAIVGGVSVPFQYFFLGMFVLLLVTIVRSKPTIQEVITAANTIGNNPTAILVLVIGCIMLIESKINGLDSTVAGTIIGYGGNMLQSQIKDQLHPPGSIVKSTSQMQVETPPDPTDPKA